MPCSHLHFRYTNTLKASSSYLTATTAKLHIRSKFMSAHLFTKILKDGARPGTVAQDYNPSTLEGWDRKTVNLNPAWGCSSVQNPWVQFPASTSHRQKVQKMRWTGLHQSCDCLLLRRLQEENRTKGVLLKKFMD